MQNEIVPTQSGELAPFDGSVFASLTQSDYKVAIMCLGHPLSKPVQEGKIKPGELYLWGQDRPFSTAALDGSQTVDDLILVTWRPHAWKMGIAGPDVESFDPNDPVFRDIVAKFNANPRNQEGYAYGPEILFYHQPTNSWLRYFFNKTARAAAPDPTQPANIGAVFKFSSKLSQPNKKNQRWWQPVVSRLNKPQVDITTLEGFKDAMSEFMGLSGSKAAKEDAHIPDAQVSR